MSIWQWQPTPVLSPGKSHGRRSLVGCSPWGCIESDMTEQLHFDFSFSFHALEKEMATHSSVLAWRIPGTGEPGGLPSLGSHRVGHDWSDLAAAAACQYGSSDDKESACNAGDLGLIIPWRREWQPIPLFFPENSMDGGVWGATVHGLQRVGHDWVINTNTRGDGNCRTGSGQAAESDHRLY